MRYCNVSKNIVAVSKIKVSEQALYTVCLIDYLCMIGTDFRKCFLIKASTTY